MGHMIKVRVHHSSGKVEKRGILVEGNARVPLNESAIGIVTPCTVEIKDTGIYLNTPVGVQCIEVGYRWKGPGYELEFIELPEVGTKKNEDKTKVVHYNDIKQPPAPTPQMTQRDDATSIILGMKLPDKRSPVTPAEVRSIAQIEVRGKVDDIEERKEWLKRFSASFIFLGVSGEIAARLFFHFSTLTNPYFSGAGFLFFGAFGICIAFALSYVQKLNWPMWDGYGKLSKWSWTLCLLSALGFLFKPVETPVAIAPTEVVRDVAATHDPGTSSPVVSTAPVVATVPVAGVTSDSTPFQEEAEEPTNDYDPMAREAFFSAVKSGDLSLAKKMLDDRQADVNYTLFKGATALHVATIRGDLKMIKFLLSRKANINAIDAGGATPLMWAVFKRHDHVVEHLVKKRADVTIRRDGKDRAIDIAKRYNLKKYFAMLTPKENSKTTTKASRKKSSSKRVPASKTSSKTSKTSSKTSKTSSKSSKTGSK